MPADGSWDVIWRLKG